MLKKYVSVMMLTLLLIGMLTITFKTKPAKGNVGTIYIKADGSVDPPDTPIQRCDNLYDFIDNICADSIIIQKDDIVIDGKGHILNGSGSGYRGFEVFSRKNITIQNTQITGFSEGIHIYYSNHCQILNNTVSECSYAIETHANSSNIIISGNKIVNSEVGIWFLLCSNSTICGNNVTANSRYAIWLDRSNYSILSNNNIINNNWGIFLYYCLSNNLSGNNVTNNVRGVDLWGSLSSNIHENNITKNGYGFYLSQASNITFTGNSMSNNEYAFSIWGFLLHDFTHSIDTSNSVNGKPVCYILNQKDLVINPSTYREVGYLAIVNSSNILVESQTLINNGQGLLLAYTNNSKIKCNNFIGNFNGIRIYSSFNNTFSENSIMNNSYGIVFYNSSCNKFYYNNFINNTRQIHFYQSGCTNYWDNSYPSGGNYWSNYNYVDANSDGIGDKPYIMDDENQDRYPLIAPFKTFDAGVWNETSYYVNFISNSSIMDFQFNPTLGPFLKFNVTGSDGTIGFCRVTIPKNLLWVEDGWTILVDDQQITNYNVIQDESYTYLYFTYNHSTKTVTIKGTHAIPEFPPSLILSLLMILSAVDLVFAKKKTTRKLKT